MQFVQLPAGNSRSHQIMLQIEEQIHSGAYQEGQRIPTGKELAETFGVSRSVVREAVKLLEAKGLIVARQGSGVYVTDNTSSAVSRLLDLSVGPQDGAVQKLLQFREALESSVAEWAAESRTDAQLDAIREAFLANQEAAAAKDFEQFTTTDFQFHAAVAEASENPYVATVLRAVHEMQHDVVALVSKDIGSLNIAVDEHQRILDAIAAQDPSDARDAVQAHIRTTADNVRKNFAQP